MAITDGGPARVQSTPEAGPHSHLKERTLARATASLADQTLEATIEAVEYEPDGRVTVSLKTTEGPLSLTMTATGLLNLVNMSMTAINKRTTDFIRAAG